MGTLNSSKVVLFPTVVTAYPSVHQEWQRTWKGVCGAGLSTQGRAQHIGILYTLSMGTANGNGLPQAFQMSVLMVQSSLQI